MGMTVFVLQAFAVQGRASGGAAEQEAAYQHVAATPDHVTDALEAEHRVEDIEGNRRHPMDRVSGSGRHERGHGAGLADAFLEDLSVFGFAVRHERAAVHRSVFLAFGRVDPGFSEQALHAEGTRFVRDDRHDELAEFRVTEEFREHSHERHCRRQLPLPRALYLVLEDVEVRRFQRRAIHQPPRPGPVQRAAVCVQVLNLLAVGVRTIEIRPCRLFVADRYAETARRFDALVRIQVLFLMHGVRAFITLHAVTLDGLDQDHGWPGRVVDRALECCINLLVVVPASPDAADFFVR